MKTLSICSVLSLVAAVQSTYAPNNNLYKRDSLSGSPCDKEGSTMCPKSFEYNYLHCVHGKWMLRDNPPGT
ncbi:hypothetical protein BB560_006483, partial [Smittium megazygosporum]